MKKQFYIVFAVTVVLSAILIPLAILFGGSILIALATTAGTTCYHFLMRLCVGYIVKVTFPKQIDLKNIWFREHTWEKPFYRFLRVRKWARHVPTFDPAEFDLRTHTYTELARQMCLSELVHELIILFGFAALFFCFFFDDPLANLAPFLITSVLAGLYDLQFLLLQRYNRPKVLRLLERERRKAP